MTVQNLAAKTSGSFYKFLPYYLNKLRFLRPQLIMNSIFALLSYPLAFGLLNGLLAACVNCDKMNEQMEQLGTMAASAAAESAYKTKMTMTSLAVMGIIIGIICLVGLFVFTFVTTLRGFRYFYDKNTVDMDYSLPVNHNTRFFADLAAVFTTSILPHLIAVLIGIILLQFMNLEPMYIAEKDMFKPIMVQYMFTGLFSCIMQMAFSLLMISVCGKKAEACIYPVLINIAVPIIHALCISIIETSTYGSVDAGWGQMLAIAGTSPLGMIIMSLANGFKTTSTLYSWGIYTSSSIGVTLPVFRPEYGITALVLTIVFFAGAYFLMKYRRAERVGMPYVYKGMNLVIPGVIIFTISLPICNIIFASLRNSHDEYSYSPNPMGWIVGLLISTFIVYVIMELISGRAFRRFHLSVAKWAGTVAACAVITAVLTFSNGFGRAYYVPDSNSVAEVSMSLYDNSDMSYYNHYSFSFDDIRNPEVIKTVTEIHRKIPKDGKSSNYLGTVYTELNEKWSVYISYSLKNGETVLRQYNVSEEQFDEFMQMAVTPEVWYAEEFENQLSKYLSDEWTIRLITLENDTAITHNLTVQDIMAAAKKDSEKVNYDLLFNQQSGDYKSEVRIEFQSTTGDNWGAVRIPLYSWMENTMELLINYEIGL